MFGNSVLKAWADGGLNIGDEVLIPWSVSA